MKTLLSLLFYLFVFGGIWMLVQRFRSPTAAGAYASACTSEETEDDETNSTDESAEDFLARQRLDKFEHHLHDRGHAAASDDD